MNGKDVAVPLVAAIIGGAVALAGSWFAFENKNRELDIQMLKLALGILREDPNSSKISAVRGWAVDVINGDL
ncbi:MAG: hypothetical protein GY948_02335 [Alphaproteobacteria bacterium]|nr:hypothetical protein [Alphaproteobacteria bacterium]